MATAIQPDKIWVIGMVNDRLGQAGDQAAAVGGVNSGPANFVEFGAISFFPLLGTGGIDLNQTNIISPGAK